MGKLGGPHKTGGACEIAHHQPPQPEVRGELPVPPGISWGLLGISGGLLAESDTNAKGRIGQAGVWPPPILLA